MTVLYFAEKQIKRYPLRSAAYMLVCFLFVAVLIFLGTISFSVKDAKENFKSESSISDRVVVRAEKGITREDLLKEKYVCAVDAFYTVSSNQMVISLEQGEDAFLFFCVYRTESSLPKYQASIYEREKGRSPLLLGRFPENEKEVLIGENSLRKIGAVSAEYNLILGAQVSKRVLKE